MHRTLLHVLEGGALAVLGALSAGVMMLGGVGGVLSAVSGAVVAAAASTVTVALIGLVGSGFAGVAAIGVALVQRDGRRRGDTLARIEAKVDDTAGKVVDIHVQLGERVAALEALVPAAEARQRDVDAMKQDIARIQGQLRRD